MISRFPLVAAILLSGLLTLAAPAYAYDCPQPSRQLSSNEFSDVHSSVSALGGLSTAAFDKKSATVTEDLFSKYPNADKIVIANSMISLFCQVILSSTTMSDAEKLDQLFRLEDRVTGVTRASVPLSRSVAAACATTRNEVLAPILALFKAWQTLDVDLYLAQWGPDAIARSSSYTFKASDYSKRRRADFANYRAVTVASVDPRIEYVDGAKAKVANTYTMQFTTREGRVLDERDIRESYVLECVAKTQNWLIRENSDYQ